MTESNLPEISPQDFKEVCARTMYSIDGLWFLAVEEEFGFEAAFALNQKVWQECSVIHGRRLAKNMGLKDKSPLEAFLALLSADPIWSVHRSKIISRTDSRVVIRCPDCPIQVARIRDGRGVYNGKPGCSLYLEGLASVVDPRIEVVCLSCAPNPENPEYWCEWEFKLKPEKK